MSGKQNFAWYRFDARHSVGPRFHAAWVSAGVVGISLCAQCSKVYRPQRSELQVLLGHLSATRPSRTTSRDTSVTEASGSDRTAQRQAKSRDRRIALAAPERYVRYWRLSRHAADVARSTLLTVIYNGVAAFTRYG